ncbi:MAG: c-type cytochrome [Pseudomonadota bacterium]|nr:c-type cytochrome [Pseudomonadota bacterium]
MLNCPSRWLAAAALCAAVSVSAAPVDFSGIGRAATPAEVKAWDIDVRPDFKGLPPGSGTVTQGQDVWEAKCSSCHGVFGESNETFSPLVGGTTADDVKTGHVARLNDPAYPGRTTLMKVATVSTLWDYINRAMPWNAPKSLTHDEVYAVTAYLLNLGNVVPADFTLSDRTMAEAQARLPNRNGMTTDHGLWPGRGFGNGGQADVKAVACMKDCAAEPNIRSSLPEHARNAHGNLAAQNRVVGAELGADTTQAPGASPRAAAMAATLAGVAAAASQPGTGTGNDKPMALLNQNQCLSCHAVDRKMVGPALRDVAAKHKDQADLVGYLQQRIQHGGQGVWGPIPMPPQSISADDAKTIASWLAAGAPKQ